jgi:hypothetical protein
MEKLCLFVGIRELFLLNPPHHRPTDKETDTQTTVVCSYERVKVRRG